MDLGVLGGARGGPGAGREGKAAGGLGPRRGSWEGADDSGARENEEPTWSARQERGQRFRVEWDEVKTSQNRFHIWAPAGIGRARRAWSQLAAAGLTTAYEDDLSGTGPPPAVIALARFTALLRDGMAGMITDVRVSELAICSPSSPSERADGWF